MIFVRLWRGNGQPNGGFVICITLEVLKMFSFYVGESRSFVTENDFLVKKCHKKTER